MVPWIRKAGQALLSRIGDPDSSSPKAAWSISSWRTNSASRMMTTDGC
jgi:hypothetical protein